VGKVFINYRRGVSNHAARHLASLLAGHLDTLLDRLLGRSRVFIDLKGIGGFSDWLSVLKDQVAGSKVMVSVIDHDWVDASDKDGNRRLDQENDFVRFEIEEAIRRHIPVLPVLLDGAPLPPKDKLPPGMHGLRTWQAMPLSTAHFERDAKEIARIIGDLIQPPGVSPAVAVAAALVGLAAGIVADRYWRPANGVDLSKALRQMQQERDVAVSKLANAERTVSDIEGKLTAANTKLAEATKRAETLQKELERAKPEIVACLTNDAARSKLAGDVFRDCWLDSGQEVYGPSDVTGEYLPWLSKITGKTYRLLTEAEWEYAARAGTNGAFSFDGKISAQKANYNATSTYDGSSKGKHLQKTVPVKSFTPNPWGLYQMHGNVWELEQDCKIDYKDTPGDGSAALAANGCPRVVRGGSWSNDPKDLRSANRLGVDASDRVKDIGFRVARTLIP
jgi:hypothetical protein